MSGVLATRQLAGLGALNRSEESLTLDVKSAAGRAVLGDLLGRADVFVQNLGPGAAQQARTGISVADIAAEMYVGGRPPVRGQLRPRHPPRRSQRAGRRAAGRAQLRGRHGPAGQGRHRRGPDQPGLGLPGPPGAILRELGRDPADIEALRRDAVV